MYDAESLVITHESGEIQNIERRELRVMRNLLYQRRDTANNRGAALILEIIIYLVIVALIAVAVISSVRAIRDLTFASHARGDLVNVQSWIEGKYAQDNKYPGLSNTYTPLQGVADAPILTTVGSNVNKAAYQAINGSGAGYCLIVWSSSMSDDSKSRFWITSEKPNKIMQQGTATNGNSTAIPSSGISGLNCPW